MKVAIHRLNSGHWWHQWEAYCQERSFEYQFVNCYEPDIIEQLRGFDILLWNFHHMVPTDLLMARHVLYAAEAMGIKVFPNFNTCWHFDDKIAETYLLQAINAPMVPSWMFYDKQEALHWLDEQAVYPLVGKLRRGAGSYNVRLLRTKHEAKHYTRRMFGRGYSAAPRYFQDVTKHYRLGGNLAGRWARLKKLPGYWRKVSRSRSLPREKGYVYFQKFIPDNQYDVRLSVIGKRAWGFTRNVRPGDFRASGSGEVVYDINRIPLEAVRIAHQVAAAIDSQSICLDFVQDANGQLYIVEISYGFVGDYVYACPGYWDRQLRWHEGHIHPERAILDDLIGKGTGTAP